VHPNTLRNRLRRCVDSCDVDLSDADTRLILMLHLKLTGLRAM
jgi:DNA-binding PucR family transcriptional regulator